MAVAGDEQRTLSVSGGRPPRDSPPPGVGGHAMSETRCMSRVRLRPVVESELADLVRLLWDPLAPGAFKWFGFRMKTAREIERRWHEDGLIGDESSFLTVDLGDGSA
jgi:hypothetical protein